MTPLEAALMELDDSQLHWLRDECSRVVPMNTDSETIVAAIDAELTRRSA